MSNRVCLTATRSLELLARLEEVVSDYATREEQLIRDFTSRRYHQQKSHREALHQADAKLSTKLGAADAITRREEDHVRGLYNQRRATIQRIHHADLGDTHLNARRAKEKFLSDLQMRHFNAKRNLPLDLEAADQRYAEFSARLKEERVALTRVEQLAADALSGYKSLHASLPAEQHPVSETIVAPEVQLRIFQERLHAANEQVKRVRLMTVPALFRGIPLPGWITVIVAACGVLAFILREHPFGFIIAGGACLALLALTFVLYRLGLSQAKEPAAALAQHLADAAQAHEECRAAAAAKHEAERQHLQNEYERTKTDIDTQWKRSGEIEDEYTRNAEEKFQLHIPRALATADRILAGRLKTVHAAADIRRAAQEKEGAIAREALEQAQARETAQVDADEAAAWDALTTDWENAIHPVYNGIFEMQGALAATSPDLDDNLADSWNVPAQFTPATRFANLRVDLTNRVPKHPRLALPGPPQVSLPVALSFPEQGCLLLETEDSGNPTVIGTLNLLILRLLATMPPGKANFTIIDPVGLGRNFAGLMHLADYEENLINRRIWTQRDQIEERLSELNEHIEKVIQMYLRNEFANITEYNAQAGSVAEKYHFLIIADFPANFGESAAKRLQSIISSGPRCGVFTLMHWDQRQPAPEGVVAEELRKNSAWIKRANGDFVLQSAQQQGSATLHLEPGPDSTVEAALVHKIGQASIDSNRVEVPFRQIAPDPEDLWKIETTNEVRIPIGRTGATKLQYLAIGKGTRQHALFAGKTGSGKSTLFHVIITNLALACSPEQIEFYLIDFKKGVEFKCYASKRLPHAKVIAIESDREFGLSVLQRVDDELKRRGDLFRKLGVQDVAGYKKAGGSEPMPRSLLIIDEFQEFFTEDDSIAQSASMLFDRIVRQGRAFGIHVLLGSQTLGGAYTLARATLGQMVIRVALQCNEADAYLIMDENNSAPRLLSRPGEGIYNDAAGAVEGNSPFQVVWLSDDERDRWLDRVNDLAAARTIETAGPIVFEGNAPADIRENQSLERVLTIAPTKVPAIARAWLGAPNAIKGPTEALFHRQSGNNLLVVGQRDEAALTMLGISMLALAAQYPKGTAKFILFHAAIPESADAAFIDRIVSAIPHEVTSATGHQVMEVMAAVSADLKARNAGDNPNAPDVFVFIHGLSRFKKLRFEDDFSFGGGEEANPGMQLNEIINEGSSFGIHLLITVDTYNNVNRFLNRKALGEFEMRVVFQMSANDSASLIDSPQASGLGLHRAILYNENLGQMETFRPYATPDEEWFTRAAAKLTERQSAT